MRQSGFSKAEKHAPRKLSKNRCNTALLEPITSAFSPQPLYYPVHDHVDENEYEKNKFLAAMASPLTQEDKQGGILGDTMHKEKLNKESVLPPTTAGLVNDLTGKKTARDNNYSTTPRMNDLNNEFQKDKVDDGALITRLVEMKASE